MTKYQSVYQQVKDRIASGQYSTDQKLPDGATLAQEFACSELTVKKALDILVGEGFIVRKRGSGTFVKRPLHASSNSHLNGTKYRTETLGQTIATSVIHFSAIPATEDIAQKISCSVGEFVYDIIRVRHIDDIPSIIEHTYMALSVIPGLTQKHVENSIYDYIQKTLRLTIHSSDMDISVMESSPEEQGYLQLQQPEKLVTVKQTAFLDNGQVFEYSVAKHLWNTFNFSTTYVKI